MFISLVREHHWPPSVLEGLFFDREDHKGLFFWFDDIKQQADDYKDLKKKKSGG